MSEVQQIDRDKLGLFVKQTGGMVAAGFNCAISLVGDRLGLFKELAANGPYDSEGLAGALGLQERWVREWLHHQACIGQVEYDAATATFAMSPEAAAVSAVATSLVSTPVVRCVCIEDRLLRIHKPAIGPRVARRSSWRRSIFFCAL